MSFPNKNLSIYPTDLIQSYILTPISNWIKEFLNFTHDQKSKNILFYKDVNTFYIVNVVCLYGAIVCVCSVLSKPTNAEAQLFVLRCQRVITFNRVLVLLETSLCMKWTEAWLTQSTVTVHFCNHLKAVFPNWRSLRMKTK